MVAWAALGSLASNVAGSLFSGLFNSASSGLSAHQQYKNQSKLNKQTYQYNLKLQKHQNAFSQSMFDQSAKLASTAHQIEVNDLRSAGLNPILSATGGNGASVVSPMSGGSAGMSGGSAQSVEPGKIDIVNAINSAKQVKNDTQRVKNETRMVEPTIGKMNSEKDNTDANTKYVKDQNEQYNKYNPQIQERNIAAIDSQIAANESTTAKNLNDIKNSNEITKSQILLNRSAASNNYSNSAKTQKEVHGVVQQEIAKSEWIRKHPHLYSAGQTLQNIAPGLFGAAAVGGAASGYVNKPRGKIRR